MSFRRVALVTCASVATLSDDDRPLLAELWALGVKAEPAVWDDPGVDWSAYDSAVLRSTWDYHLRAESFAAWLSRLETLGVPLWNPAAAVRANGDKTYLKTLEASGVSVPPTLWISPGDGTVLDQALASRGWNDAVLKPVVSASAFRTSRVRRGDARGQELLDEILVRSGAMVQPYLAEVAAEGEWSFVFIDGKFSHSVLKTPRAGDFRVQEEHGGRTRAREAPASLLAQAQDALALGAGDCLYARVDGVRRGGELVVMELELVEPALFLAHAPGSARRLAEAIKARLPAVRPSPRP